MGGMAVKEREAGECAAESIGPSGPVGLPHPRGADGWTAAELDDFPDDGLRYELLDGSLIVSPSPVPRHQIGSMELAFRLKVTCPDELRVLAAPLDWRPRDDRSFQPDVLVVRREDATGARLTGTPLLLAEVASPSTARVDRVLKFSAYAEAGVPQYWIVEPGSADDGSDAAVEVYDLVDGAYVLQGRAIGSAALDVDGPVPVRVVPAELVR